MVGKKRYIAICFLRFMCTDPSVLVDREIFLYSYIFPHQFIFLVPVVVLQHLGAKRKRPNRVNED